MPVTKEQAVEAPLGTVFHYAVVCTAKSVERWRANGKCKTWKTRPNEFRLPIKYGLRDYFAITELNAAEFHHEDACPWKDHPNRRWS